MATIRTVSTHGKPTKADGPVLVLFEGGRRWNVLIEASAVAYANGDRWVPLAEIADLPPAPRPPVTIELTREIAEHFAGLGGFLTGFDIAIKRACREALEGDR